MRRHEKGDGAQRGKHLYYGCIGKVRNFPFPSKCEERAVNARIVDDLAWRKISRLMSSPELMRKQSSTAFERCG